MPQTTAQTPTPQAAPGRGAAPARPVILPEYDALPIWKMEPPKLVAMVKDPSSTVFQKAIACKKLAFVGGKEAVTPMAALLSHPQLSCYARFGLEPNPDPSVDDAFRDALPKLQGRLKIGVITSIGVRKDPKALDALTKLIDDSDAEVARAAAASVGMIGGMQASRSLQAALGRTNSPVFPVAARAALLCAEGLMASNRPRALDLYTQLSAEPMPKPVRLAAIRVLNGAGPAPEYAKKWPAPTGEAADRDKSGFLGRDR
ncbi:MAG TPA: HEAT repeat domain-containing protein [Verrucomicrobiae bacterium]|nr:HEAT repeat domain-containing protein [Verrucomicrobiae bacterium]